MSERKIKEYDCLKNNKKISSTDIMAKKWIRAGEGVKLYSMSRPKLIALAMEAGAAYKIDTMILINKECFERYLETFRVPGRVM